MRWGNVFAVLSVMLLAVAAPAEAQEAAAQGAVSVNWVKALAAIGFALAVMAGGFAQAKIISTALESIARNPGAAGQTFLPWFLGVVFVESLVIFAFVVFYLS